MKSTARTYDPTSQRLRQAVAALVLALAIAFGLFAGGARAQSYDAMSCDQLWYARNAIYAARGYCFRTDRARSVFGAGCFPPYGRLSPAEQRQVDFIRQVERRRGCDAGGAMAPPPPMPPAGGYAQMSCDQLWYARNAIFAAKGHCFKTERARSVFGPGCFPPFGRLNGAEERQVSDIRQWERAKGCR